MSVIEPAPTSANDGAADQAEFPVALRGYDKQRVDVFVKELKGRLEAERRRVEQADRVMTQLRQELSAARNPAPPSFEHLGLEAAKVLEQAGSSAKFLVDEARSRGEAVVREAEGQAAELILRAEERAAELEEQVNQTLAGAAGERARIVAEATAEAEHLRAHAEEDARAALEQTREVAERIREKARGDQMAMQAETERLRESRDRMIEYLSRIHADLVTLLAEASSGPIAAIAPEPEEIEEELQQEEEDGPADLVGAQLEYHHEELAEDLEEAAPAPSLIP